MDWNTQPQNGGQNSNQPPCNNGQEPKITWSYPPPPPPAKPANSFAIASTVCGITAVLSIATVYLPLIFGSLAIIFALLSKGYDKAMHTLAKSGIVTSIVAMLLTSMLLVFSFSMLAYNKEFQQEFNSMYEDIYGESLEDQLNELLKEYEAY